MYLPAFPAVEATFHTAPGTAQLTLAAWFAGLAVGQIMQGTLSDRLGPAPPADDRVHHLRAGHGGRRAGAEPDRARGAAVRGSDRRLRRHGDQPRGGARPRRGHARRDPDVAAGAGDGRGADPGAERRRRVPDASRTGGSSSGSRRCMARPARCWRGGSCRKPCRKPAGSRSAWRRSSIRYGSILREPVFRAHAIMGMATTFCMFAYLGGSSPVFIQGFGLSPSRFGLIFGLCSCGLIAGSQINARLLPRFGLSFMLRFICRVSLAATTVLLVLSWSGVHVLWMIVAPIFLALELPGVHQRQRHRGRVGPPRRACRLGRRAHGGRPVRPGRHERAAGRAADGRHAARNGAADVRRLAGAVIADLFRPRGERQGAIVSISS